VDDRLQDTEALNDFEVLGIEIPCKLDEQGTETPDKVDISQYTNIYYNITN